MQTAVIANLENKQLLLFAFARQNTYHCHKKLYKFSFEIATNHSRM